MEKILSYNKFCNEKLNIQPMTKDRLNEPLGSDYAVFKKNVLELIDMIKHDSEYGNEIDKIDFRMQFDQVNSDIFPIPSNAKEMTELWNFVESNLKQGNGFHDGKDESYIFIDAYYNGNDSAECIDYSMTVRYNANKEFVITIIE
jgi:hypothetical protein